MQWWYVLYTRLALGPLSNTPQISLGDQSSYYLTTAKNELGVVVAHTGKSPNIYISFCGADRTNGSIADSGDLLYPKSWKDMVCSRTGLIEERKVAQPHEP